MQNNKIVKTETMEEFLARGGKVTHCPTGAKGLKKSAKKGESSNKKIDLSQLPTALKIKYGIKD